MNMGIKHKELVEKATHFLQELVPNAADICFEEIGSSLSIENPPNAAVIVLSYRDSSVHEGISAGLSGLFSKKVKSIHIDPESGELLAIKNRLA